MAASTNLSTPLDLHHLTAIPHSSSSSSTSNQKTRSVSFTSPLKLPSTTRKHFTIFCKSNLSVEPQQQQQDEQKTLLSLSDQLKPLSSTVLTNDQANKTQLLSKPKSIWVNPTKPKRSVISLQRHKRSGYEYNPQLKDLKLFAQKLNDCEDSESAFLQVLDEMHHPPTRENSLLVLNSLKPWQKTTLFLKWIRTKELFPLETIFYNVTMKSLRFGRQFDIMEELANEMINDEIQLDNITYSTIITCAKRCNLFDKAIEWFERMYKTGLMPDEITYSAILDVYAKLGKVEEVLSLYERGRATGWIPDAITFAVLGKVFGEAGDYDGIRYVLQEMKSLDVKPNVTVYNTLLESMGKAGKPGLARALFEEMVGLGLTPDAKTLTALVKIYGKARWARDALELWERMKVNEWPMDFILYNTLLSMCADVGLEEDAEKLFADMKDSKNRCRPDSWSYSAMLKIYGSGGKADKAMKMFEEMTEKNVELNVMGCTCLIQCFGKAMQFDDLVRVFNISVQKGIRPDDRLCGCLLSILSLCEQDEDANKILSCLTQANPKLVAFIALLKEQTGFETLKAEFKTMISDTSVEARRPFCNCLIDISRKKNLQKKAHDLLYLGTLYGLYPGLHNKTDEQWCLDVRSLSVGAAHTALEEWIGTLFKLVERKESLPMLFLAQTGTGTHRYSQGLGNAFASHVKKLAAPFTASEEKAGCYVATKEELISWVESRNLSSVVTL